MEWLPIETAPKDGTIIDLWASGERVTEMSWYGRGWSGPMPNYDAWGYVDADEATHWMPLPEPPPL